MPCTIKLSATVLRYNLSLLISCDSVLWGRSCIQNATNIYRWGIFQYIFCAVSTVKTFRLQQQSIKDNENVVIHIEYWFKQLIWMTEWMNADSEQPLLWKDYSECRTVKPMHNNMHNIHGDRYCTNMEMEYWAWWLLSVSPIKIQNLLLCNHVSHVQFCEWQQTLLQMCLKFCLLIRYNVQKMVLKIQVFAFLDETNSIWSDISVYYCVNHTDATWRYP